MRTARAFALLTAINVVVLLLTLAQHLQPVLAAGAPPVLRGSGLEIVDGQNRVRASISVLPAGDNEATETVLLRLITERGRPTVKIGSSEPVSGMSITGPTGTTDTYLI